MREDELDELERLAEAATPGPWRRDGRTVWAPTDDGKQNRFWATVSGIEPRDVSCAELDANAEFLAVARSAVPALVARVREMEAERARRSQSRPALEDELVRLEKLIANGGAVSSVSVPWLVDEVRRLQGMLRAANDCGFTWRDKTLSAEARARELDGLLSQADGALSAAVARAERAEHALDHRMDEAEAKLAEVEQRESYRAQVYDKLNRHIADLKLTLGKVSQERDDAEREYNKALNSNEALSARLAAVSQDRAEARREALEEAAKECEADHDQSIEWAATNPRGRQVCEEQAVGAARCADRIRALIEEKKP